jgi:hypothetical protein
MASDITVVNPKLAREQLRDTVLALPWVFVDPETDCGKYGLTPLLFHRIGHYLPDGSQTIAQVLVNIMIDAALDGHFRSLEEILIRIDGDAKSTRPAARIEMSSVEFDDATAQRILDALCDPGEGPPGD